MFWFKERNGNGNITKEVVVWGKTTPFNTSSSPSSFYVSMQSDEHNKIIIHNQVARINVNGMQSTLE